MAIAICMISNVNNCFQNVTRASGSGFAFWLDRDSRTAVLQNPMNDEKQAEPACCLHADPATSQTVIFTEMHIRYPDSRVTRECLHGIDGCDLQLLPEWRHSVYCVEKLWRLKIHCVQHAREHETFVLIYWLVVPIGCFLPAF